jgi:hypothetical protein
MGQKSCGSFDQSDLSTRDEIGSRPPVWRSSGLAGGKMHTADESVTCELCVRLTQRSPTKLEERFQLS